VKRNQLTQFFSIFVTLFVLSAGTLVDAQEVRATLNGRVEDSAHAAVPHATVTARENASGVA